MDRLVPIDGNHTILCMIVLYYKGKEDTSGVQALLYCSLILCRLRIPYFLFEVMHLNVF